MENCFNHLNGTGLCKFYDVFAQKAQIAAKKPQLTVHNKAAFLALGAEVIL